MFLFIISLIACIEVAAPELAVTVSNQTTAMQDGFGGAACRVSYVETTNGNNNEVDTDAFPDQNLQENEETELPVRARDFSGMEGVLTLEMDILCHFQRENEEDEHGQRMPTLNTECALMDAADFGSACLGLWCMECESTDPRKLF